MKKNHKKKINQTMKPWPAQCCRLMAPVLCAWPLVAVQAQDGANALGQRVQTGDAGAVTTPAESGGDLEMLNPVSWRYRDWRFFTTVTVQAKFDDNILQTNRNKESDFIGSIAPYLNVEYHPAWNAEFPLLHLDYSPRFIGYVDNDEFNAIDHRANLRLIRQWSRSKLTAGHVFDLSSDPVVEQSVRGKRHSQNTDVAFDYEVSGKLALTLAPYQHWHDVENGITTWEYGANLEAKYHATAKLDLLAGYGLAKITSDPGADGWQQKFLVGAAWQISELNRVEARLGLQHLEFSGDNPADSVSPLANLAWTYQFAPKTKLTLAFDHSKQLSAYSYDQVNETTSGRATIGYDFTSKIGFDLHGGGGVIRQESTRRGVNDGGDLTYWQIGVGLAYNINLKTQARLGYDFTSRDGNATYDAFDRHVVALELTRRF